MAAPVDKHELGLKAINRLKGVKANHPRTEFFRVTRDELDGLEALARWAQRRIEYETTGPGRGRSDFGEW